MNDNIIATAGRDPHVRVYDRRKASEENNQPMKKFCPHHLVSSIVPSYFLVWIYKTYTFTQLIFHIDNWL